MDCRHEMHPTAFLDPGAFGVTYLLKLSNRRLLARTISALFVVHPQQAKHFRERDSQSEKRGLVKPDAAEQLLKPRVAAHGIEEGVYFEPLQDRRLLFVSLVAPEECPIVIAERQVRSNKGT